MASLIDTFISRLTSKINKAQGLKPSLDVPVSTSGFKFYHNASVGERESLHAYLDDLEKRHSLVELDYQPRGFDDHKLLRRVKINTSRDFLAHIGEAAIVDQIQGSIQLVVTAGLVLPDRFESIESELTGSWGEGRRYYNCGYESPENLIDALRVIEYLNKKQDGQAIDYRSLSVLLFQDSKRLERLKSLISNLLKPDTPELDDISSDSVLAYWGLYRFPPLLQLRGRLIVNTTKGALLTDNAWPFIGIPPDAICSIKVESQPDFVLFIENKTTFERYCREIDDSGLIIYTNGFPSRRWQPIFQSLDASIDATVDFFHWGDVDLGGFKILRFMTGLFDRPLHPHKMDIITETNAEDGVCVDELLKILDFQGESYSVDAIRSSLTGISGARITRIEQENLALKSPALE